VSDLVCALWPSDGPGLVAGVEAELDADESHHLCRVKRLAEGAEVWAIGGTGKAGRCRLLAADAAGARVAVEEVVEEWREPPGRVVLAQSLVRPAAMDLVVSGGTALGMYGMVPLRTERVERGRARPDRWSRLAAEAAKQCGRGRIPRIGPERHIEELAELTESGRLVVAHADAPDPLAGHELAAHVSAGGGVVLVIGPEGDLTGAEQEQLRDMGAVEVHLGPRRLRSEDAALKALALLLD
jgi:16S rRNA (uracil1498-N3)-methyltransferase